MASIRLYQPHLTAGVQRHNFKPLTEDMEKLLHALPRFPGREACGVEEEEVAVVKRFFTDVLHRDALGDEVYFVATELYFKGRYFSSKAALNLFRKGSSVAGGVQGGESNEVNVSHLLARVAYHSGDEKTSLDCLRTSVSSPGFADDWQLLVELLIDDQRKKEM